MECSPVYRVELFQKSLEFEIAVLVQTACIDVVFKSNQFNAI